MKGAYRACPSEVLALKLYTFQRSDPLYEKRYNLALVLEKIADNKES